MGEGIGLEVSICLFMLLGITHGFAIHDDVDVCWTWLVRESMRLMRVLDAIVLSFRFRSHTLTLSRPH